MNLRHLEVFRHVMQTGSVKGAAAVMKVSDAAASKLLATAERRMGLALFERAHGRLIPTPEARNLYEEVERLWEGVERIGALTRSLAQPSGGALALAISPSFGVTTVPLAASRLQAEMASLTISVDLLTPHLLVQNVVDGIADLGICFNPQAHPIIETVDRLPCKLVCVMPKSHPLAKKKRVQVADLVDHPVVSFPLATSYGLSDEALFGAYSDRIERRLNVRSGQTACWFSLAGAGVAIVDQASVAGSAFPDLAIRPYQCEASIEIVLLRRRDRPLSRAATLFCTYFRSTWTELS
jgi:DNA-binding transcriptional LysR family regulator